MPWSRREILATVGVTTSLGLTGCSGDETTGTQGQSPKAATESLTPTKSRFTEIECEGGLTSSRPERTRFEAVTTTEGATPSVAVQAGITRAADAQNPARVTVAVRNTLPHPQNLEFGSAPPLSRLVLDDENGDSKLELWPVKDMDGVDPVGRDDDGERQVVPDERYGDCWTAMDQPTVLSYFEARLLDSCEVFSSTYEVLAHPENSGACPSGTFTRTYSITNREAAVTVDFTLEITAN